MMKSVSIFIRAKNEAKGLEKTLQGIQEQSLQPQEIVVLDNESTDGTPEIAKKLGANVRSIPAGRFSYGRALNMALELTSGDVIVFLSAHSPPVNQDWLKELMAPLEADPGVHATFGRQIPEPGINLLEEWLTYRTFPARPCRFLGFLGFQNITFSNGNAAVPKELLNRFKFREDLTFAEDIEWWKRVQKEGCRVQYCPDSVIYHSHALSLEALERRMFHVGKAMKQCGSGSVFANPLTCAISFAGTVTIDLVYCLVKGYWSELKNSLKYRHHFFRGLRQGLNTE